MKDHEFNRCIRVVSEPAFSAGTWGDYGGRRGTWSVKVGGNWRVTFKFAGEDITDVDYEDYH
jgi:hypothetical protein